MGIDGLNIFNLSVHLTLIECGKYFSNVSKILGNSSSLTNRKFLPSGMISISTILIEMREKKCWCRKYNFF
jgi:hypothetical protein